MGMIHNSLHKCFKGFLLIHFIIFKSFKGQRYLITRIIVAIPIAVNFNIFIIVNCQLNCDFIVLVLVLATVIQNKIEYLGFVLGVLIEVFISMLGNTPLCLFPVFARGVNGVRADNLNVVVFVNVFSLRGINELIFSVSSFFTRFCDTGLNNLFLIGPNDMIWGVVFVDVFLFHSGRVFKKQVDCIDDWTRAVARLVHFCHPI